MAVSDIHLNLSLSRDGEKCHVTLESAHGNDSILVHVKEDEFDPHAPAKEAGRALAERFLSNTMKSHIQAAWRKALDTGAKLYLWLSVDDQDLSALPWEKLWFDDDPTKNLGGFLCLQSRVHLIRQVVPPIHSPNPLSSWNALAVWANPNTSAFPLLPNLEQRCRRVKDTLRDCACEIQGYVNRNLLKRIVAETKPDLFHFEGHGRREAIILEGDSSRLDDSLSATDLRRLFGSHPPQLVFLSACHAGCSRSSIAAELARNRVPAVVAMQGAWEVEAARHFVDNFYSGLAGGDSVEEAVARARQSIRTFGEDWAMPVLYLTMLRGPSLPQKPLSQTRSNLLRPPHCIGRDSLLEKIKQDLQESGRIVALTGAPGSGRHTVALEYACKSLDDEDYQRAFEITAPDEPTQIVQLCRLSEYLGIPAGVSSPERARHVLNKLQQEKNLLIVRGFTEKSNRQLLPKHPCNLLLIMESSHRFPVEVKQEWKERALRPLDSESALQLLHSLQSLESESDTSAARSFVEYFGTLPYWLAWVGREIHQYGGYARYLELIKSGELPPEMKPALKKRYKELAPIERGLLQKMAFFAGKDIPQSLLELASGLKKREFMEVMTRLETKGYCAARGSDYYDMHEVMRLIVQEAIPARQRIQALTRVAKTLQSYLEKTIAEADWPKIDAVYTHLETAREQGKKLNGGEVVSSLSLQAGIYLYECGVYREALKMLEEGKFWEEMQRSGETLNSARFLCYLARAEADRSPQSDRALEQIYEAEKIAERLLRLDDEERVAFYNSFGYVLKRREDYAAAMGWYERALHFVEKYEPEAHALRSSCLNYIGGVHLAEKNYSRAFAYFEEALEIDRAIFPEYHDRIAIRLNTSGQALRGMGFPLKALKRHEEALEIYEKVFGGRDNENVADTLVHKARAHRAAGERTEATERYREGLQIYESICGKDSAIYKKIEKELDEFQEN